MSQLSLNPSILLSPTSAGYVAYDTSTDRLHELNPTAALLVELCDGTRSVDEVIEVASPLLPPNSKSAIDRWFKEAVEVRLLLKEPNIDGSAVNELSETELVELASRLRDDGKVQAAWLCQQRASELLANDAAVFRELGELAHIIGKRSDARLAYEHYLRLEPSDSEIQHLLTSLRDDDPPPRVPDEFIRQLYQRFATFYEDNMCDELDYEGPVHLREVVDASIGARTNLSVLDLGCGTGLAGRIVSEKASRLVGIDLSPDMIDRAAKLGIYSELNVAEVADWLTTATEEFDLIMACDTLIYFGDIGQVISPASRLLRPGGTIAFSVELAETGEFQLTDNGRYVHHPDHINSVARNAGFHVVQQNERFLRMEYGVPVTGLFVALQRPE